MAKFEERTRKFVMSLVVMLVLAIVGFSAYQSFTGVAKLTQPIAFGLLGLAALGLVRVFIASGESTLNFENAVMIFVLIGAPIAALFYLPKVGINLFSSVGPLVGASGNFDINIALEGTLIDMIKNNLLVFTGILVALYWFVIRKK